MIYRDDTIERNAFGPNCRPMTDRYFGGICSISRLNRVQLREGMIAFLCVCRWFVSQLAIRFPLFHLTTDKIIRAVKAVRHNVYAMM